MFNPPIQSRRIANVQVRKRVRASVQVAAVQDRNAVVVVLICIPALSVDLGQVR